MSSEAAFAPAPTEAAPALVVSAPATKDKTAPVEDVTAKSRGWPKGKKRYPKMPGAPKQPLSGYVHFLNDRRDDVRRECPDISFAEISKKLATEWSKLDPHLKQKYVERAEQDKERYSREFSEYKRTDGYKKYMEAQERNKKESEMKQTAPSSSLGGKDQTQQPPAKKKSRKPDKMAMEKGPTQGVSSKSSSKDPVPLLSEDTPVEKDESTGVDIPIFTEGFLAFNKRRESELRQLRRQVGEMEEQNAVLQKHVDNMQSAISRLEAEAAQHAENSTQLVRTLDSMRKAILDAFTEDNLTVENVDDFVRSLHAQMLKGEEEGDQRVQRAREALAKVNYKKLV